MFSRSITKNNLIYEEYLGDGDTSSFKEVVDSNPYKEESITPVKLECVGHVQKRLGTRLRKLVKEYRQEESIAKKEKIIKKIIKLSGKGKLTDTVINSMQNFYGFAIRNNLGNIYAMKKAIGAVLFHCTLFKSNEFRHRFCPTGPDSWCKFQLDKLNGTQTYKANISIPKWIHDVIQPVFMDLRNDSLLEKCLHGQTQNANEALNQVIWSKIPKNVFVGKSVLELGINTAIVEYNDGSEGVESVLKRLGVSSGRFTRIGTYKRNTKRIADSVRKYSEQGICVNLVNDPFSKCKLK